MHKPTSITVAREFHRLHKERKKKNEDNLRPLQLVLLTSIANGFSYVYIGGSMVDEPVKARLNGEGKNYPYFVNLMKMINRWGTTPVDDFPGNETKNSFPFLPVEAKLIKSVYNSYGNLSGSELLMKLNQPNAPWNRMNRNAFIRLYYTIIRNSIIKEFAIFEFFMDWKSRIEKRNAGARETRYVVGDINEKMA